MGGGGTLFGSPHLTSPVRKEGRKKRSGRNRTQYEKEVVVVLGQFLKKASHNVISTIVRQVCCKTSLKTHKQGIFKGCTELQVFLDKNLR